MNFIKFAQSAPASEAKPKRFLCYRGENYGLHSMISASRTYVDHQEYWNYLWFGTQFQPKK